MYILVVPNISNIRSGNITFSIQWNICATWRCQVWVAVFNFRELVLLAYQGYMFTAPTILYNYHFIILSYRTLKSSLTDCNQRDDIVLCVWDADQHERGTCQVVLGYYTFWLSWGERGKEGGGRGGRGGGREERGEGGGGREWGYWSRVYMCPRAHKNGWLWVSV